MLQRTLPAGFIAPCLPVPPISFVPAWPWSSLQPENGGAVGGRRRAADCYALGRLVQPDCCYGRSPLTRILGLAPMTNCAALPAAARFREAQTKRKVQNGRPVPWPPPFLGAILFNCRRPLTYSPVCRPLISVRFAGRALPRGPLLRGGGPRPERERETQERRSGYDRSEVWWGGTNVHYRPSIWLSWYLLLKRRPQQAASP